MKKSFRVLIIALLLSVLATAGGCKRAEVASIYPSNEQFVAEGLLFGLEFKQSSDRHKQPVMLAGVNLAPVDFLTLTFEQLYASRLARHLEIRDIPADKQTGANYEKQMVFSSFDLTEREELYSLFFTLDENKITSRLRGTLRFQSETFLIYGVFGKERKTRIVNPVGDETVKQIRIVSERDESEIVVENYQQGADNYLHFCYNNAREPVSRAHFDLRFIPHNPMFEYEVTFGASHYKYVWLPTLNKLQLEVKDKTITAGLYRNAAGEYFNQYLSAEQQLIKRYREDEALLKPAIPEMDYASARERARSQDLAIFIYAGRPSLSKALAREYYHLVTYLAAKLQPESTDKDTYTAEYCGIPLRFGYDQVLEAIAPNVSCYFITDQVDQASFGKYAKIELYEPAKQAEPVFDFYGNIEITMYTFEKMRKGSA